MKKYLVSFERVEVYEFEVEADSETEAIQTAEEMRNEHQYAYCQNEKAQEI